MQPQLKQCCVCRKVVVDGKYVEFELPADYYNITHGFCPACLKEKYKELEAVKAKILQSAA